ncbi:MAG: rRNA maturation RNase YbeY [Candidatus Hydrogenedentota bacterium]
MSVELLVLNESSVKRLCRQDKLQKLAEQVYKGEGYASEAEVSLLFCDDVRIQALNSQYRGVDAPTDVLAFPQEEHPGEEALVLGDIVISLETVAERSGGDRDAMRREVDLLLCHGLLHLLGYDHQTEAERREMAQRQAHYLARPLESAWIGASPHSGGAGDETGEGDVCHFG